MDIYLKLYIKKNNHNSLIININEKNKDKNHPKNLNQLFKNKIKSKTIESRKKLIIDSNSKDKKINKSNVMNLLDNFNLFHKVSKNLNSNIIKNNKNNKNKLNKSNIIKTSAATNNNSKYKNKYKKDFSYIQSSILTFDKKRFQDEQNNNGFNTDRTRNIYNLKKQSCFDKENNNNLTNSDNSKINSKNKKSNNSNNNNINKSHIPINPNDKNLLKIKDYYIKRKKNRKFKYKRF